MPANEHHLGEGIEGTDATTALKQHTAGRSVIMETHICHQVSWYPPK